TPEERAAFEQHMRERQAQGSGGGQGDPGNTGGASPGGQQPAASNPRAVTTTNASTIDSLFGPLPSVASRARAWLYINKQLKPVNLRLGISDGTYTEILNANEIQPRTEVVTNVVTGTDTTPRPGGNA